MREKVDNPVEAHTDMFWRQADFGYVKERLDELTPMCFPQEEVNIITLITAGTNIYHVPPKKSNCYFFSSIGRLLIVLFPVPALLPGQRYLHGFPKLHCDEGEKQVCITFDST